jgi:predicted ATPase/class 3 adenylate cyclase
MTTPEPTALPTGTVTFLFTDVEGSTRLAESLGDAFGPLLERHHALLRDAIAAGGGVEVSTEGDAFFAVFTSAPRAVAAVAEAQRALAAEPWTRGADVRVRMGLHTGEAVIGADNYVGLAVHRAARVASSAHGGQILVSGAAGALAAAGLPPDVELRDLGRFRLRDLTEPEQLYQVVAPGLADDFPPPRTLDATPNNLPTQLTTFLGREKELRDILASLPETRLLTLSGPGGTGKTRLSLEVAGRVMDRYPGGVYFVDLSSVTEPDLVPSAIAQAIGLADPGGRAVADRIAERLRGAPSLLVLDNFEQVEEAAPVVADLLSAAPPVTVLVTTRNVLHLYGEREYPVPPLGLPDPRRLPDLATLSHFESVALFIERAVAVRPDFRVTNENAPAVAQICVRLDGLPLAIELVAARIRLLPPQAMLERLGGRLDLARSGARDLPERQQTLRGAISWSYEMLPDGDAALFAALSVFSGGAELEHLEVVCGGLVEGDPLDGLASLVDKSLVRQIEGVGGAPRFSMLETIREYAAEQLSGRQLTDDVRTRHGEVFCGLAEAARDELVGADQRLWLDRLEQEHDNLRAALAWAHDAGRIDAALRLVANLWRFWQMRGYLVEGYDHATAALAAARPDEDPLILADALEAAGGLAYWLGDPASIAHYERGLAIHQEHGDRSGEARQWYNLAGAYTSTVDRAVGYAKATDAATRAVALYRELGDDPALGRALWSLANAKYESRDWDESRRILHEALPLLEAAGDRFMWTWGRFMLALSHVVEGDYAGARDHLAFALNEFHAVNDVSGLTLVLDGFAQLAQSSGDLDGAARLSGFVARLEAISGTGLNASNRLIMGLDPRYLREEPATADAWIAGERMTTDEAVAVALALEAPAASPED